MTKKIFFIFMIIGILLISVITYVLVTPYFYYNSIVNNNEMTEWFTIPNHRKALVTPSNKKPLQLTDKDFNSDLWQKFHFQTIQIPLPVKNPYFIVAPIIKYNQKKKKTDFGISIYDGDNEILAQVYFLPSLTFPNLLTTQKLFELPIVANHIQARDDEAIWKDIFTKDISDWNLNYSEMIYNLYLLQMRSSLISAKANSYYFLANVEKAVLNMDYPDTDFNNEIIMSKRGGQIYSFILLTRRDNLEAQKIRYKVISEISYMDTTPSLTNHIYNEFKSLPYQDQVDHIGMLYLLSAWSHDQKRLEIIVSAIQYLERGRKNQRQLEPLYEYTYRLVGKTFSKKFVGGINLAPEIMLERNIELEQLMKKEVEKQVEQTPEKTLSVKEQYEKILKETKSRIKNNSGTLLMN